MNGFELQISGIYHLSHNHWPLYIIIWYDNFEQTSSDVGKNRRTCFQLSWIISSHSFVSATY